MSITNEFDVQANQSATEAKKPGTVSAKVNNLLRNAKSGDEVLTMAANKMAEGIARAVRPK